MDELNQKIEALFCSYPEVQYGIAKVDFSEYRMDYKSVLAFAVPYSEKLNLKNYYENLMESTIEKARECVNRILEEIEDLFLYYKIKFIIPPFAQSSEEFLVVPFSFKFACVKAGIGWIGKNDVIITEKYGPRVSLGSILFDSEMKYETPILESKCPVDCKLCINACPYHALKNKLWDTGRLRSDIIDYHLCNQKRSMYIKKHNRKNSCGLCIVSCPYGL